VAPWTCPRCDRQFGRRNQSHSCAPALALDEYLAAGAIDREVFDTVVDHLQAVGPIIVEAVQVGIFIKRARTFAELRPRRRGAMLAMILSRRLRDPRIVRTLGMSGLRTAHFILLESARDVDETVREWLTEAYLESPT
jgi:hypothetical protein